MEAEPPAHDFAPAGEACRGDPGGRRKDDQADCQAGDLDERECRGAGASAAPRHPRIALALPALDLARVTPRLLGRRGGLVVGQGGGDVTRGPAGAREPPTQVEILGIHPLALVEAADLQPRLAAYEQEGGDRPGDSARTLGV